MLEDQEAKPPKPKKPDPKKLRLEKLKRDANSSPCPQDVPGRLARIEAILELGK